MLTLCICVHVAALRSVHDTTLLTAVRHATQPQYHTCYLRQLNAARVGKVAGCDRCSGPSYLLRHIVPLHAYLTSSAMVRNTKERGHINRLCTALKG